MTGVRGIRISRTTWIVAGVAGALVALVGVTSFGDLHRAVRAASLPEGAYALPGDAATAMLRPCARKASRPIDGHWMPEAGVIAKLEAALPGALARAPVKPGASPVGDGARFSAAQWVRQYVGVIRDDKRLIIANVLRKAELPAIREEVMDRHPEHDPSQYYGMEPLFVCDSMQGNFGFEYDPQSGAFNRIAADSKRSRHVSRYAYDIAPPPEPGKR